MRRGIELQVPVRFRLRREQVADESAERAADRGADLSGQADLAPEISPVQAAILSSNWKAIESNRSLLRRALRASHQRVPPRRSSLTFVEKQSSWWQAVTCDAHGAKD